MDIHETLRLRDVSAGGPGSGRKPGTGTGKYPKMLYKGPFNTGKLQKVPESTHQALFHNTRKVGDQVKYLPDGKTYTITRVHGQPAGDNSYNLQHEDGTKKWTDAVGDLAPTDNADMNDYVSRIGSRYRVA